MKGIVNTYCNPYFLDDIIKGRKQISYSAAYDLIDRLSNIIVDISPEELKKKIENDEVYRKLNKRQNKSIKAQKWINKFSQDNICDDIFLINEGDIKDYKRIRKEFGCLIIANNEHEIKAFDRFTKVHPFNLVPEKDKVDDPTIISHDSWTQFFNEFKMTPLNAVVITDNYLFGSKFDERKENSLFALLRSIAPTDLQQDFHIAIFFNNGPDKYGALPLKKEKAVSLIEEIKALNLCKSVKVTIIAHDIKSTTHDRELISNYYYMSSGKGFGVVDEHGVQEVAKGQVQHIFSGMTSNVTVKQLQAEVALWLKPIFEKIKGNNATYSYIVGDHINRLLE